NFKKGNTILMTIMDTPMLPAPSSTTTPVSVEIHKRSGGCDKSSKSQLVDIEDTILSSHHRRRGSGGEGSCTGLCESCQDKKKNQQTQVSDSGSDAGSGTEAL
ncbi:hypothetical protein BGW38_002674, partial [Lunasporangiospora selenospora]